jgi:site-specific DNA-methyltransferase (adenine-specific)
LVQGDCRELLLALPENSVDSIVCDPPYHLTNNGGGPHGKGLGNAFARAKAGASSTGFMGQRWDGGDTFHDPATWAAALRVLKPGGFLIAFGGTRTYHRLVCAIEDGGFEVRDMLAWLYGSGFPKGTDKAKIPEAWRGWNTALKPAIEPICLARKPMVGTLAENLTQWGTGALWIEGCRISTEDEQPLGRWPANVIHDGSDEVLDAFAAFGPKNGGHHPAARGKGGISTSGHAGQAGLIELHADAGTAARFFYCAKASRHDRNDGLQGMPTQDLNWSSGTQNPGSFQSPNTNRAAPNHHPTVKPTSLMRWLVRLVTPPGGTTADICCGSGSTLKAADLEGFNGIGMELDPAYIEIARRRIGSDTPLFSGNPIEAV